MPTLTAAQVAALVKQVGFPESVHVTMVAIARAESGFRVEVVGGPNSNGSYDRGLFQINDIHGLDRNRLVSDATYNTQSAKNIYDSQGLGAWSVYNSGAYKQYEAEARQGVAGAASATGSVVTPGTDSAAQPGGSGITYGGPGPQLTDAGVGQPLDANAPREGGIGVVKILGATLEGDIGSTIIGEPKWSAGVTTIPNLQLTAIDEDYVLLAKGLWRIGSRIQWSDLDLRIDTHTMSPGGHGTGQAELGCVDDIVYALMSLTGPRTASGVSATEWIAQELEECGIDPGKYFLGESVPTQSEIARDVDDQGGQSGEGQKASAWTTIVRLAKELGKYVFVSGRRLVFGSAAFAMQWTAEGPIKLGYHVKSDSEKFTSYPTTTVQSISSRSGTVQVTGRVPHNRAPFFRPGVPVDLSGVPGAVFSKDTMRMMVWSIDHTLVNDVDGAEIVLVEPVDPPPQPPQTTTAAGVNGSPTGSDATGSGYGSQAGQVVALCLQQVGKQYIYGAEAAASDANPRAFDCCLTLDSMISTSSRGPVPIVEVIPGDTVWCWEGGTLGERKVIAVAEQPVQPVFAVRTRNSTVRASANHPFLVLRRDERKRDARGGWLPVVWRSEWVRVDALTKGDLLVSLERSPVAADPVALSDGTVVDDDVAWLLGEILGDGHVTSGGVNIAAFRPGIRDRIREIVGRAWGATATDHETHGVIISSARLRNVLTDLGMRVPAHDKRVPDALRTLPAAPLRALLAGYAEADGHFDKRGHQSYSSCSRRLIDDVRALHRMLGDKVSNVTTLKRTRPIVIKGVTVKNARDLHSFTAYPESSRRNSTVLDTYGARRALPDRAFAVERVYSVTADGEEPTYDLEIEGAHNYVADGLVAHNSELIEWACARIGVSPTFPDGSQAQEAHCRNNGTIITATAAIGIKGALLFNHGGGNAHVALSLGDGSTVEAMNESRGVTKGNANNRGWTAGARIPGCQY